MMPNSELKKKYAKALIIGGGISGYGAAMLLRKLGLIVAVSDQKPLNSHFSSQLLQNGILIFDKGHHPDHIKSCDLVVTSPGIPQNNLLLVLARERNLKIVSEVDLALGEFEGIVLAITGTNGKSTICSMIEHGLRTLGFSVKAGGNFGDPPSLMIAENRAPAVIALELSSYQLELSQSFKALCASFTNFSPDHLARHGTLEDYFRTKWSIFDHLHEDGLGVITRDILEFGLKLGLKTPHQIIVVDEEKNELNTLPFNQFPHNIVNSKTAFHHIHHLIRHVEKKAALALDRYKGLPYRCENIGEYEGVTIYNDSKSTNVDSTLAALSGFKRFVTLMMGGQGKGESYTPILKYKDIIGRLITFGHSGDTICQELSSEIPTQNFTTLSDALSYVKKVIKSHKDPLLFSPGCASFDEFKNFEDRGAFFNSHFF